MILLGPLDDGDQLSDLHIAAAGDDNDTERRIDCRPANPSVAPKRRLNRPGERCAPLPCDPAHGDVETAVTTPHDPIRLPTANGAPDSSG